MGKKTLLQVVGPHIIGGKHQFLVFAVTAEGMGVLQAAILGGNHLAHDVDSRIALALVATLVMGHHHLAQFVYSVKPQRGVATQLGIELCRHFHHAAEQKEKNRQMPHQPK